MTAKSEIWIYMILIAIFVLSINIAFAQGSSLECSIKNSCETGEIGIFSMFSDYNSHVGTIDYYTNKICCKLQGKTLGTDCSAANKAFVFSKYQADNSHVSVMQDYYTNDVCLSVDSSLISCHVYETGSGTCDTGTCIATIYANDNSHVAGCAGATATPYTKTICCGLEGVQPGVPEVCDNHVDDDRDGDVDCDDLDCISNENCEAECDTLTGEGAVVCRTYSNCYWISDNCYDCSLTPLCYSFEDLDSCQGSCNMGCKWEGDPTNGLCENPKCTTGDSDFDSICDGDEPDPAIPDNDNCINIANSLQDDCDDDDIGDACDSNCANEPTYEECSEGDCADCADTTNPKDGICDTYNDVAPNTCEQVNGIICSTNQDCIGGVPVISEDSSSGKCCLFGHCGLIEVLLTGETQYLLEESECRNPDDEGIGKKIVYKYSQSGSLLEQTEEDCTILPSETVPFYSLMSIITTVLVLISFYAFRSKIFSYFRK